MQNANGVCQCESIYFADGANCVDKPVCTKTGQIVNNVNVCECPSGARLLELNRCVGTCSADRVDVLGVC